MTYEELKNQTTQFLINKGLTQQDDSNFYKDIQRQHQIVINGQPNVQVENIHINFEILGEGSINDNPMIGFKISINNQDTGDYWISDTKDLQDINI